MGAAVALAITVALVQVDSGSEVVLRRGVEPPAGRVLGVSLDGVRVGEDGGGSVLIGLDRVIRVEGRYEADWLVVSEEAERVWRATRRLERGDAPAAEPMLEELFEVYRGRTGPTAAVVAEGLLRCRVRRGSQVTAVEAWLAHLDATRGSEAAWFGGGAGDGSDVIDGATGLAPALPPMWVDLPAVQSYASSDAGEWSSETANDFSRLYRHAARFESGWRDERMPDVPDGPGVSLVKAIVGARAGDAGERAANRERLRGMASAENPGWVEAWRRAGIGRSLVLEEDRESQLLGVVELLAVPALLNREHPYLSGLCLAEAAVALARLGDVGGAERVRRELLDRHPDHPVTGWAPIRDWSVTTAGGRRAVESQGGTP